MQVFLFLLLHTNTLSFQPSISSRIHHFQRYSTPKDKLAEIARIAAATSSSAMKGAKPIPPPVSLPEASSLHLPEPPSDSAIAEAEKAATLAKLTASMQLKAIIPPSSIFNSTSASELASEILDDADCELDPVTLGPSDPECLDENYAKLKTDLSSTILKTATALTSPTSSSSSSSSSSSMYSTDDENYGEMLERGWEKRGNASALRRNGEIWKFALKSVFKVLKPRSLRKKGKASEEEIVAAKVSEPFIHPILLWSHNNTTQTKHNPFPVRRCELHSGRLAEARPQFRQAWAGSFHADRHSGTGVH